MTQQVKLEGNKPELSKGMEVLKAKEDNTKVTNEHDVERERLIMEYEKSKASAWEHIQKMQIEANERMNRFDRVARIAEKTVVGGMILAGYIVGVKYNADIQRHKVEYGNE